MGYVLRNPVIEIDDTDYTGQLTKARLVPETPTQTLRTLDPGTVIVDVDSATWTLELAGIQGALAVALTTAAPGTVMDVELQLEPGTGKRKATFSILAKPVPFGGDQGAFTTFDESFAVVDIPDFTTSV